MPSPDEPNELQTTPNFPKTIQAARPTADVTSVTGVLTDIGRNAVTERAEQIRYSTDEDMVWQESPSLALLVPRFLKYAVLMGIIVWVCSALPGWLGQNKIGRVAEEQARLIASQNHDSLAGKKPGTRAARAAKRKADVDTPAAEDDAAPVSRPAGPLQRVLTSIQLGFGGLFALLFLGYFLRLKSTKYCASSQRLILESGTLHVVNRPYELHQLGSAVIAKPLFLRMFGVANLEFANPRITLYGLRNASYVRDILRQGGQLEAQRADKIRWR